MKIRLFTALLLLAMSVGYVSRACEQDTIMSQNWLFRYIHRQLCDFYNMSIVRKSKFQALNLLIKSIEKEIDAGDL